MEGERRQTPPCCGNFCRRMVGPSTTCPPPTAPPPLEPVRQRQCRSRADKEGLHCGSPLPGPSSLPRRHPSLGTASPRTLPSLPPRLPSTSPGAVTLRMRRLAPLESVPPDFLPASCLSIWKYGGAEGEQPPSDSPQTRSGTRGARQPPPSPLRGCPLSLFSSARDGAGLTEVGCDAGVRRKGRRSGGPEGAGLTRGFPAQLPPR